MAIAGIALYTVLVGADAAVVRAAVMGGLYVLALYFGRQMGNPKEHPFDKLHRPDGRVAP